MQIPRMKRSGGVGLFDFRGFNVRLAERAGLVLDDAFIQRADRAADAMATLQFAIRKGFEIGVVLTIVFTLAEVSLSED